MKEKDYNFINILNLILLIIVALLITIGIYIICFKKDVYNSGLGKINNITEYSKNESTLQQNFGTNKIENSSENNVYYEFDGKTVGSRKLETNNKTTYDMNNVYDRYYYKYSNGTPSSDQSSQPSLDNVSSTIKDGTLSKSGATIIIKDENKMPYRYSKKWYSIEKKNNGKWENLNEKKDMIISNEEDIPTLYHQTVEFTINWTEYYGELEKGIYRIAKKTYTAASNDESEYIYTEFEIK